MSLTLIGLCMRKLVYIYIYVCVYLYYIPEQLSLCANNFQLSSDDLPLSSNVLIHIYKGYAHTTNGTLIDLIN